MLAMLGLFRKNYNIYIWNSETCDNISKSINYKQIQESPRQTKERPVHELSPGAFRNKSSMWIVLVFLRKNTRIHTKMGEIHELFVVALSFLWFAGATPDKCEKEFI